MAAQYDELIGDLARAAEVAPQTVRIYANLGLLDSIRTASGLRLFRAGQAPRVREIYAERMANRGKRAT
jgi:DNA-binding transcriptional MerR regulator